MAKNSVDVIAYTDGGSRGNPGPAALGVVICDPNGVIIKEYGERLGVRTNNEAEYEAVLFALRKIKQLYGKEKVKNMKIEVRMDSELVCKQLTNIYKIENEKIFHIYIAIHNLTLDFGSIAWKHIPREQNKDADRMVNEALDRASQETLL